MSYEVHAERDFWKFDWGLAEQKTDIQHADMR